MEIAEKLVPVVVFVAGLGLIAYGAWEIYEPAGLIVGGLMLCASALRFAAAEEISL